MNNINVEHASCENGRRRRSVVNRSIFSYQETIKVVSFNKIVYLSDDQAHSIEIDKSRNKSNRQRFSFLIKLKCPKTYDILLSDGKLIKRAKNLVLNFFKTDEEVEKIEKIEYVSVDTIENIDPDMIQKNPEGSIDINTASMVVKHTIIVNDSDTHKFFLHSYKNRSSITSVTF